jgi:hypothetical protein
MEVFMCAIARFTRKTATFTFLLLLGASAAFALGEDDKAPDRGSSQSAQSVSSAEGNQNEISELRRQLADQQRQIEELRVMVYQQAKRIDNGGGASSPSNEASTSSGSGAVGQVASMVPMLPSASSPVTTPVAAVKQTTGQASAPKSEVPAWVRGYKPILLFYLSYQAGTRDLANRQTIDYNAFLMKRGYFGADINITPYLTSRFVGDVYLNSVGDQEVRAKYIYGKFHTKGNKAITEPYTEFGLVHIPWLDFEEAINGFRMQDTMFLERNNVFNSADAGVLVGADIGGSMSSEYKSNVDSHYAGRYGSWQVGVYNGGGYHALELNTNKVFEARLTVRPIPNRIGGLQFSVFGVTGRSNAPTTDAAEPPKWESGVTMVSYESRFFTFTGQGYLGIGNQAGTAIESIGNSVHQKGFSVFAAAHIPIHHYGEKVSIIGRMDEFNSNTRLYGDLQRLYIAGFAWHLFKSNIILLDYQRTDHSLETRAPENRFQITLQTAY